MIVSPSEYSKLKTSSDAGIHWYNLCNGKPPHELLKIEGGRDIMAVGVIEETGEPIYYVTENRLWQFRDKVL